MKPYVITGGPSVGKTTVIELLAEKGFGIMPEIARMIIEEEQIKGSDILPWKNLKKFQEQVVLRQLEQEKEISKLNTFLDRSIIDGYAYCVLGNIEPPAKIERSARGRYEKVFLLEPLKSYIQDETRKEDREVAHQIHSEIIKAYEFFGYDLIHVPVLPPTERFEFIVKNISQ